MLHLQNLKVLNITSLITEGWWPVALPSSIETVDIFDVCGHIPWTWMRMLLQLTHVDLQKLGLYFSRNIVGAKCHDSNHLYFVKELAVFQHRSSMAYETFCMPPNHCTRDTELVPDAYPIRIFDAKGSAIGLRRI